MRRSLLLPWTSLGLVCTTPVCPSCTQMVQPTIDLISLSVLPCPGFDTVTTAISWSLMYLVTNPSIQRKIQKELGRWWLHSKGFRRGPCQVWAASESIWTFVFCRHGDWPGAEASAL
jgi:hypothetical protein